MTAKTGEDKSVLVSLTDAAVAKLREVIEKYPEPVAGLRLKIVGRTAKSFEHALTVVEQGSEPVGDAVVDYDGLRVFVEEANREDLDGVRIHYAEKGEGVSGLEFENPNPPWADPLSARVQQVVDEQINPAIASHGGFVTLLDVRGKRVYIEMGGGCQGCGMADVTLKQGIEVAFREAVPEIEEIIDSTDHASGDNPYYQPSKK